MPAFTLSSLLESRATRVVGLALAYWLTVVLAIELVTPVEKIALFWPPNAIVAAVLMFTPRRDWPMYLAAMAVGYFAGRLPGGQLPVVVYVVFCIANIVEVLMVAEVVKRFAGGAIVHDALPRVLPVMMLALIPATLVSATMAASIVTAKVAGASFWMAWIGWLTGDLSGMLLVLPVLLAWVAPGAPPIIAYSRNHMIERTVIGVLLAAVGLAIPTALGDQQQISLVFPYLVFPILIWTAMRTGIRSTTLITLVVGLYAVFLTFLGQGPYAFKGLSAFGQVVVMKGGLITITVTTIFLSVLVTGRKQVEVALKTSRRTLRSVIDAVPAMINAKDKHSRYVFMNRYQGSLYGVEPEAAVGRTAGELVGADYGAYTSAIDVEVLRTNTPKVNFEETWVDPNGRLFTLLTTKVPLRDETGAAALVVTVSLDISERKMAEEGRRQALEKAEEASQAKSEFLATISHELRTPLNAILGFADILSHQYMGPLGQDKYVEYASDIHASGKYLLDLVNDILDISTIEAGKKSLYKEELSVGEAVDECSPATPGSGALRCRRRFPATCRRSTPTAGRSSRSSSICSPTPSSSRRSRHRDHRRRHRRRHRGGPHRHPSQAVRARPRRPLRQPRRRRPRPRHHPLAGRTPRRHARHRERAGQGHDGDGAPAQRRRVRMGKTGQGAMPKGNRDKLSRALDDAQLRHTSEVTISHYDSDRGRSAVFHSRSWLRARPRPPAFSFVGT
ncbi:MAG: MASE1 domain-containing protein [Rhodospirillales bacterium]|nr:MASE1 domain-containing protein [Rhodospirillales bacterium]